MPRKTNAIWLHGQRIVQRGDGDPKLDSTRSAGTPGTRIAIWKSRQLRERLAIPGGRIVLGRIRVVGGGGTARRAVLRDSYAFRRLITYEMHT